MTDQPSADEFPVTTLRNRATLAQLMRASRMWWITLVCLVIAVVLAWQSLDAAGPEIVIHFPDGHGLQVGDAVRHRGIEVGQVHAVELAPDLSGVDVSVTLRPGAELLARRDTRFWIVRPQLSLTGVRGLETAVGAKYIDTSPGDAAGEATYEFIGLAAAPPDELGASGIEIILRGTESYGLNPGAPVMWRGVDGGEILSVDLASDSRFVDVRARVDAAYRRLVRPNSRFWVTRGIDVDAGLTGITLRAESLTTIARGGVAFITPDEGGRTEPVAGGHVFELHAEGDRDWIEAASTVNLIDFALPPTVLVRARWQQKQLGFTRDRERTVQGLLVTADVGAGKRVRLIAPTDGLTRPESAIEDSWQLSVVSPRDGGVMLEVPGDAKIAEQAGGVASCLLTAAGGVTETIADSRVRVPVEPEDCCLVRSVASPDGPSSVIESVSRMQLAAAEAVWSISHLEGQLDDWHGATVVAAEDGKAIGLFLVARQGPVIVPFATDLVQRSPTQAMD